MLLLVAALALIAAFVGGGKLQNVSNCPLRGLMLPVISVLLTSGGGYVCSGLLPREPYFIVALCAGYALIALFIALNFRLIWFSIPMALGTLCNFAVIAANDFYMPIGAAAQIPALLSASYKLADSSTRLLFLADIIYIPFPRGLASVGDILLAVGAAFLIFYLLRPRFWKTPVRRYSGK